MLTSSTLTIRCLVFLRLFQNPRIEFPEMPNRHISSCLICHVGRLPAAKSAWILPPILPLLSVFEEIFLNRYLTLPFSNSAKSLHSAPPRTDLELNFKLLFLLGLGDQVFLWAGWWDWIPGLLRLQRKHSRVSKLSVKGRNLMSFDSNPIAVQIFQLAWGQGLLLCLRFALVFLGKLPHLKSES